MSVTSTRNVQIGYSGDISLELIQSALDNDSSPSQIETVTVTAISPVNVFRPSGTAAIPTGVTIIPPPGNTIVILLGGDPADVGIPIHLTDPTSIGLDPSFSSITLSISTGTIVGIQIIWT